MEFLVADAERMYTENGKLQHFSYWSYKVLTRSYLKSYQHPPLFPSETYSDNFIKAAEYVDFCTWHRYSDFELLTTEMELEFPGILFPPIPPKETDGTMEKFAGLLSNSKDEDVTHKEHPLVRKRIRLLQLTLNAVSKINEIHEASILKAFVTLDERGWCAFREERRGKNKTSLLSSFKTKSLSFFSKIKSLRDSGENTCLNSSPLGTLFAQQNDFSVLLNDCYIQVAHMVKECTGELRNCSDVDALCKPTQGSTLPWTACYVGHLVQHSRQKELEGVVRGMDEKYASVEWNGEKGEISRVPLNELSYPSSGVSDPAVFAFQELTAQIESYCMYLTRLPAATTLKDIEDKLWFLSMYAKRCLHAIDHIKKIGSQVQSLTKSTEKKSTTEQTQRLELLKENLSKSSSRLVNEYNNFYRPFMKELLLDIARKFGEVAVVLMSDTEWKQRLSRADSLLTLQFDTTPQDDRVQSSTAEVEEDGTPSNRPFF
ncbi:Phox homologous domain [Trypanosoma melophagium]|uniref:Phox homologous domain n=1 Tax=Trypanosoma melophagium TaxID=715481 RepID=UPI003519F0B2|nr:Phox homologous domain [Trypanosoma melophagium]